MRPPARELSDEFPIGIIHRMVRHEERIRPVPGQLGESPSIVVGSMLHMNQLYPQHARRVLNRLPRRAVPNLLHSEKSDTSRIWNSFLEQLEPFRLKFGACVGDKSCDVPAGMSETGREPSPDGIVAVRCNDRHSLFGIPAHGWLAVSSSPPR
jgi:hypothetical protein